jgi:hypothetical protein
VATPKVYILLSSGEAVVLFKGKAIFPSSPLFYQAEREQKKLQIQRLQSQLSSIDGVTDSTSIEVPEGGLGIVR